MSKLPLFMISNMMVPFPVWNCLINTVFRNGSHALLFDIAVQHHAMYFSPYVMAPIGSAPDNLWKSSELWACNNKLKWSHKFVNKRYVMKCTAKWRYFFLTCIYVWYKESISDTRHDTFIIQPHNRYWTGLLKRHMDVMLQESYNSIV